MREGRIYNLSGGGRRDDEAVEIPLGDCRCSGGTLDAGENAEGPEINQHEERAEPPGAGVDYEEGFGAREVAAKEYAREHRHPYP